jgi:hypothetical protein
MSFWHDRWLLSSPLAEAFPPLFSHSTKQEILVSAALNTPLPDQLHPRLSNRAAMELHTLQECLQAAPLSDAPDTRLWASPSDRAFSSRNAYLALQGDTPDDSDASRLWHSKLPSKIKFFGWLLHRGRLNTRAYLHHRNIRLVSDSFCERCHRTPETAEHIFSRCPAAGVVWRRVGIGNTSNRFRRPWLLGVELHLPTPVQLDVIMLILWQIWKARNALIFDHRTLSPQDIISKVVHDLHAWQPRYSTRGHDLQCWINYLSACL